MNIGNNDPTDDAAAAADDDNYCVLSVPSSAISYCHCDLCRRMGVQRFGTCATRLFKMTCYAMARWIRDPKHALILSFYIMVVILIILAGNSRFSLASITSATELTPHYHQEYGRTSQHLIQK